MKPVFEADACGLAFRSKGGVGIFPRARGARFHLACAPGAETVGRYAPKFAAAVKKYRFFLSRVFELQSRV
ncbi:MAG: hypothetical protein DBX55_02565 [Verrucomicrobia bacterium]|nr:MAG: hypothetical protein DBX55_02565 [Verrucomicrobiota bacterium]